MKLSNHIQTFIKGAIIGASMLIPGVSGGTMAIILGIYNRLISAIASFRKNIRSNIVLLLVFCLGGGLGILLFANPLLMLTERFPMFMNYLFMGAVAGSIPMILRGSVGPDFRPIKLVYVLLGIAIIVLISLIPEGSFVLSEASGPITYLLLFAAGFVAAIALVLPGISVSYMLLVLGLYTQTMQAIHDLDVVYLLCLGGGLIVGIFCTTKGLEQLMRRFQTATNLTILGFVLASVAEIYPGFPTDWTILLCILGFVIGFGAIYLLSRKQSMSGLDD